MIYTKQDLKEYLCADARANNRKSTSPKFLGDYIWKFIVTLRKMEYYTNQLGFSRLITLPARAYYKFRFNNLSLKLGYSIPVNVVSKGLSLVHYGTIVIAKGAEIGENCRIHEGVTIGATNGHREAARIGNNVFLASGAKIIGEVTIADDVAIGANAVVTKSILEKGTTWGGIPAKKISDHDSHSNLCKLLFE